MGASGALQHDVSAKHEKRARRAADDPQYLRPPALLTKKSGSGRIWQERLECGPRRRRARRRVSSRAPHVAEAEAIRTGLVRGRGAWREGGACASQGGRQPGCGYLANQGLGRSRSKRSGVW